MRPFLRNKVLQYAQASSVPQWQRLEGLSVGFGAVTGYQAQGLYQSEDEIKAGPTPLYPNVNRAISVMRTSTGDNRITPADRAVISKARLPQHLAGRGYGRILERP